MDADTAVLIAIGILAALGMIWAGFLLDRRSQRARSASWMRQWTIRNSVLADLFRRWQGPLRLQDQRSATPVTKRKPATRRRRRSRKSSG